MPFQCWLKCFVVLSLFPAFRHEWWDENRGNGAVCDRMWKICKQQRGKDFKPVVEVHSLGFSFPLSTAILHYLILVHFWGLSDTNLYVSLIM